MNFEFTPEQLEACIGNNPYLLDWYDALNRILPDYEINTVPRVAAFIAQTAHESNNYTALRENLNYRAESLLRTFPKYFKSLDVAQQYAHNQEAIANRVYANRMGNGPEESGDGFRFCGRGLIQITGKENYTWFADSIQADINELPDYLGTFDGAVQSACWFWEVNNLNAVADAGDIVRMTKIINGGTIGLEDRERHYHHALHVLS